MMDGRAGHGQGLARGGIFGEFLAGVGRPSGRSLTEQGHTPIAAWRGCSLKPTLGGRLTSHAAK